MIPCCMQIQKCKTVKFKRAKQIYLNVDFIFSASIKRIILLFSVSVPENDVSTSYVVPPIL